MKEIILIKSATPEGRPFIDMMVDAFSAQGSEPTLAISIHDLKDPVPPLDFRNKFLILAVSLDQWGNNHGLLDFLTERHHEDPDAFFGTVSGLLVYSETELYTKSFAGKLVFMLNTMGSTIPGHPMVEAIPGFSNFRTWQKTQNLSLEEICQDQCLRLRERLAEFHLLKTEKPRILALHASNAASSNTLALWNMVRDQLDWADVHEVHVENGSVHDCKGCSFKACLHFGKQQRCFYGGSVVDEIYPEIEKANAVVWISPNYNDSVSANLMAVINRLTALYRVTPFYNKLHYSIVVSGNSGSDSVIKQLMNSLCINKGFTLAPGSYLHAIANDPGSIRMAPDIEKKAQSFSLSLRSALCEP